VVQSSAIGATHWIFHPVDPPQLCQDDRTIAGLAQQQLGGEADRAAEAKTTSA
jgi:hypothetical protein